MSRSVNPTRVDPALRGATVKVAKTGGSMVPDQSVFSLFEDQRLTPTQRRIAQYLMAHVEEASYLSGAEVAERASVSQPSVTRFAVALGFSGYPALRRRMREMVTQSNGDARSADENNPWQRAIGQEIANLTQLSRQLSDDSVVRNAAALLTASRPLPVIGLRVSAPVASLFAFFAGKFHPDVRLCVDGGSLVGDRLEQACEAGATAALIFALPRYPRDTIRAIATASDLGLKVITVTDNPTSPAAERSDLTLAGPVGSSLVFDIQTAPLVLTVVLLQALCDASSAESQRRLERFETYATRHRLFQS